MAVGGLLERLAAAAPVPVFVARGLAAADAVAALRASPAVRLVASPRHATVLVVAGLIPRAHVEALQLVHDQVPGPRAVAAFGAEGSLDDLGLGPIRRLPPDRPGQALQALHADVLAGRTDSPPIGPADNPQEWQGVGPHGQGGEGMMGGAPYGRPMAMPPQEGRDGLALDRLSLTLGPFLPGIPPGHTLQVGLQGDVLEEASLQEASSDSTDVHADLVGQLLPDDAPPEVSEAIRHLSAVAELSAMAGLGALAVRAARVATAPTPGGVGELHRRLARRWALRAATDGVGRMPDGTDVTDRWRAGMDRAGRLLASSGGRREPLERPAGGLDAEAVGDALVGMELGHALLTLCSLQVELEDRLLGLGERA